jgi:hypothetical protein
METAVAAEDVERGRYNLRTTLAGLLYCNVKRQRSEGKSRVNSETMILTGRGPAAASSHRSEELRLHKLLLVSIPVPR